MICKKTIWERLGKVLRVVLLAVFWAIAAAIAALAVLVVLYGQDLPDYRKLATYSPPVATRLYAADGSLLIEYAEERRVFIDFEDMPPQLINAFVAAEDKNFWHHPGIDAFGVARATLNNVIKVLGGPTRFSGASTITQQVAKNFFLTSDRTVSRKIKEAILALRLERAFSKQHIMTLYLNQIFLGARAYGVGSASLMYFNKPVAELTLAQSAFLASLPKAPNDRDKAIERRNYVLRRMYQEGFISRAEMFAAAEEELNINSGFTAQMADDFQYFAEEVRRQLLNELGRDTLYNGGLYIKTTIVPKFQKAASAALKAELDRYNSRIKDPDAPRLQGAIMAVNPHTGRVVAISGGHSFAESSYNRATQARRQPGSSIKPIADYGPALDVRAITAATVVDDAPAHLDPQRPDRIYPKNSSNSFRGLTTVRNAVIRSVNVVAAKVWTLIPDTSLEYLNKVGINRDNERNVALSLGGLNRGVTPLEMAGA
ncbi:MAG: transglycosylase domain-containing protein, partial [Alphaproteobacteria bacterium]|nr:transglycosylase domain-containing protein [Alphaproteobacteria bacterium]